jgi:hypothetical protein
MACDKVPKIIELDDYGGEYQPYEDAVYNVYQESFESKQFFYNGKRIAHKRYPMYKGKSGTFWHIISSGEAEADRLPDLRRYERVSWAAFILGYCCDNCDKILEWRNERKGKKRVLLWCRDIDYVVILDDRDEYYIFWTAYPVTYGHTRKKLYREYSEYIKNR